MLDRRSFLASSIVTFTGTGLIAWLGSPIAAKVKASSDKDTVKIIQFSDSGQNLGPALVKKVHKTDDEWKQQLSQVVSTATIGVGVHQQVSGLALDQYGNPIASQFAFTTDNPAVAAVDGLRGVALGVSPGSVHVYAGISGSVSGISSGDTRRGTGIAHDSTSARAVCAAPAIGSPLTITPAILKVTGP